jgi:hypothetical protein
MDHKISKTLSIIAGSIIIIAFFLPWTKAVFDLSASAWDMIEFLFKMFTRTERLPEDFRAFLPFLLVALPICSAIVIFNSANTLNDNSDKTKSAKVVTIIVYILVIITLLYAQSQNPFSDFSNVFDMLGVGFYLTLIGVVYYLVDIFTIKRITSKTNDSPAQPAIFCTNCGKQYTTNNAGQFCEECGSKL